MDWVSILIAAAPGLVGVGVAYGLLRGDIKSLEQRVTRSEQDIGGKASREIVDGLEKKIDDLKRDLDKRLDTIEGLIRDRS